MRQKNESALHFGVRSRSRRPGALITRWAALDEAQEASRPIVHVNRDPARPSSARWGCRALTFRP
jgi:hypothetical protein